MAIRPGSNPESVAFSDQKALKSETSLRKVEAKVHKNKRDRLHQQEKKRKVFDKRELKLFALLQNGLYLERPKNLQIVAGLVIFFYRKIRR
jgi:hypothetical protein